MVFLLKEEDKLKGKVGFSVRKVFWRLENDLISGFGWEVKIIFMVLLKSLFQCSQ